MLSFEPRVDMPPTMGLNSQNVTYTKAGHFMAFSSAGSAFVYA